MLAAAMIVSASYRTDIPAFYGTWFDRRLTAGFCRVRNPYGGQSYQVALAGEAVDGFVFWTRNVAPFLPQLARLRGLGPPFVVHYTVLDYPTLLDRSVPPAADQIRLMHRLAAEYGPHAVVWRYDPVVFSSLTDRRHHLASFGRLARALAGASDEVVISFVNPYRKARRRLDRAAREGDFSWFDPEAGEKRRLAAELAVIAAEHGMRLTVCSQAALLAPGTEPARCIDAERLARIAGRPIQAPQMGNRPDCLCHRSRDIGAYDRCPHGCLYCYGVASRRRAVAGFQSHDPSAAELLP